MDGTNSISLLCDITKIVNSSNAIDQVFLEVAKLCAVLMQLDQIIIYSYDNQNDTLIQKAVSGRNPVLNSNNKNYKQLQVPIIWKGKIYGQIDSRFTERSFNKERSELVFSIIASLLAPKLVENQKPKRAFELNNKYYVQLIDLLEQEKVYKDEQLSLKGIAQTLNLSTSYLSQIVNNLGKKSFSALINEYRVQEVTEAFRAGKHIQYSLLSIALDAGFSSKSTFNTVFKHVLGCSPSQYIKKYV